MRGLKETRRHLTAPTRILRPPGEGCQRASQGPAKLEQTKKPPSRDVIFVWLPALHHSVALLNCTNSTIWLVLSRSQEDTTQFQGSDASTSCLVPSVSTFLRRYCLLCGFLPANHICAGGYHHFCGLRYGVPNSWNPNAPILWFFCADIFGGSLAIARAHVNLTTR